MAQIDSDLDFKPQAKDGARTNTPSPLAPGGEAVIGAMANGMWKPGVMSETPDSLRRPMRQPEESVRPTSKVPDLPAAERVASPLSPDAVPFAASPSPTLQADIIRRRSQVTSLESSLERVSLRSPAASDPNAVVKQGDATPDVGATGDVASEPPALGRPLSTEAKPFSPTRGVASVGLPSPPVTMLSADAKEFVPRRRAPPRGAEYVRPENNYTSHGGAGARSRHGGYDDSFDVDVTAEEVAMHHLIEVMAHLTLNPGSFDKMVPPLVSAFGSWLEDEETVRAIVGALFEQSITDANFRFNGARLCHQLHTAFEAKFRTHLLNTCRREHERLRDALNGDAPRAHGYLLFVADLYVTLEVVRGSGQRIDILGKALADALVTLLTLPDHDNVKCVCQALKLAGYHLDATMKPNLDAVFVRLREIQQDERTEPRVQVLVLNLANLRGDNWGISRQQQAAATTAKQPPAAPPAVPPTAAPQYFGPVFYGPDGHILSAEERQFLQDNSSPTPDETDSLREDVCWDPDEEMDDEIHAAFVQFLMYGKKKAAN